MVSPLLTVLLILLVMSLLGGGFSYSKLGGWGMSPALVLLVVLVVLYSSGAFVAM